MLQIVGLLGCVYLAVKGVELVIAVAISPREEKRAAMTVAVLTLILCWICAALGVLMLIAQGAAISPP